MWCLFISPFTQLQEAAAQTPSKSVILSSKGDLSKQIAYRNIGI